MANKVPNLDCMPASELHRFWATYQRPSRAAAANLIGDTRPRYTRLARQLAHYACNKATAMECRVRGDIVAASLYEGICDSIYDRLPADLRW